MKTLTKDSKFMSLEKYRAISKSLTKASECFLKARKMFAFIALLFVVVSLNAQSFSKINGLGKSYLFVVNTLTQEQAQLQETTFNHTLPMANYFSPEFGLVGYVFNKNKDKCIKMVLPLESVHTFDFTGFKSYEGKLLYNGTFTRVIIVENLK